MNKQELIEILENTEDLSDALELLLGFVNDAEIEHAFSWYDQVNPPGACPQSMPCTCSDD